MFQGIGLQVRLPGGRYDIRSAGERVQRLFELHSRGKEQQRTQAKHCLLYTSLPLFELILIGLVGTLLSLAGLKRLDWPMIVVGGVSLGLLLLSFLLFRKPLWLEIRKKFHT